jgi:ribosomal protein L14
LNNYISSVSKSGYILQAGDESPGSANFNLNGEFISGNYFSWTGTPGPGIQTHGVFTGFNLNSTITYNYLKNVPMSVILKGGANSGGATAYNIFNNPSYSGVNIKGMSNCNVYNNTFYSSIVPYNGTTSIFNALVNIYANDGVNPVVYSPGTHIYNNIFYTVNQVPNIWLGESNDQTGFQSDFNLFYCASGTPIFKIGGTIYTFSQWQALGYDRHSLVLNPNFNNFTDFIPALPLYYGTNLGSAWQTGLAGNAVWSTSSMPAVTNQSGTWQVGARILSGNVNLSPIANAGPDQIITLPAGIDTLKGTGSDADGYITSYKWEKISGPSSGSITNINSATAIVIGLVQGIYHFQLQITDNNGGLGVDTMQLTVNAANNIPPVANAGVNQSITLPANSVTLTGSGSDADGTVVSYLWTKISGPSSGIISIDTLAATTVTGLVQGVYQFQLQVTDNGGAIGTSIVQVTVNSSANISPVANAGSDQTITLPIDSVMLSGSGSDADGTVVSYLWTKISGPSSGTITNTGSASTSVTGLVQGVYQYRLQVTDDSGATGTAVIQVTVNAAINIPPVANAGVNQSITLPANSVTLSGSGSDADGTVVSYLWTKISGPSSFSFVNTSSPVTDVFGLVQGIYQFQLKVTDNNGAIGTDIIQVIVNVAANIPPVANAGPDQSITLPENSLTLAGSGSDADGNVVSYLWTKLLGPSLGSFTNANSATTSVTDLVQGVYQFQLQVTDNNGATGKDIMQITVYAASNVPPVADAGPDQTITLPAESVTLSGSGSDADGTIAVYSWTQISGPSSGKIVSPGNALTEFTGLVSGNYLLELTVTDNLGAKASDTVAIAVAAPRLDLNVKSNTMNVYPKPVTDVTTLEINTTQPDPNLLIVITNMNGQIVYKSAITSGQTDIKQTLNLSNLIKGAYAVTVYFSNQEKQSIKILKL